jgi:hypothetical protein
VGLLLSTHKERCFWGPHTCKGFHYGGISNSPIFLCYQFLVVIESSVSRSFFLFLRPCQLTAFWSHTNLMGLLTQSRTNWNWSSFSALLHVIIPHRVTIGISGDNVCERSSSVPGLINLPFLLPPEWPGALIHISQCLAQHRISNISISKRQLPFNCSGPSQPEVCCSLLIWG